MFPIPASWGGTPIEIVGDHHYHCHRHQHHHHHYRHHYHHHHHSNYHNHLLRRHTHCNCSQVDFLVRLNARKNKEDACKHVSLSDWEKPPKSDSLPYGLGHSIFQFSKFEFFWIISTESRQLSIFHVWNKFVNFLSKIETWPLCTSR